MPPNEPIPVVLLITELEVGGAEQALMELALRIDRREWNVSVIGLGPEGPLAQPLRNAGFDVACLGANRRRPVQALRLLIRALRKHRPRLVQSFLFHANIAARLARPFVRTQGRSYYATVAGVRVAERGKRWHLRLDRLTKRWCDHWVCVSEGVKRHSIDVAGLPANRLSVIPNGVAVERFENAAPTPRRELGIPEDVKLALFVGRIDLQKGWRFLLDAIDAASSNHLEWHLIMAGDGPEREALRARIDGSSKIHWLGRRDDVPRLLAAADLFILPSLWEGMPNAVLEAMASGKPTIATRVEGSEDLVIPGETGWLVPASDAQALAKALQDAGSDSERLRRFGANARRLAQERYSWDHTAQAHQILWRRILQDSVTKRNEA